MIVGYLDSLKGNLLELPRTTILDIAEHALNFELEPPPPRDQGDPIPPRGTPINRFSPNDQQRITKILAHNGWVPKRKNRERWWEPGPDW